MGGLLLVMVGGAASAGLRYGVSWWAASAFGLGFPWGTLIVNLVGGLLMGLLVGAIARDGAGVPVHLLVGTGILGGFTTFSAFSLEVVAMAEGQAFGAAAAYILASVVGAGLLLVAGMMLGRAIA